MSTKEGKEEVFMACREEIIKYLKKNAVAVHCDQSAFREWKQGKIGTSVLIRTIAENNSIPDEVAEKFNHRDFENWVHSLGW